MHIWQWINNFLIDFKNTLVDSPSIFLSCSERVISDSNEIVYRQRDTGKESPFWESESNYNHLLFPGVKICETSPEVTSAFLIQYWYKASRDILVLQALPTFPPEFLSWLVGELSHILIKRHGMIEELLVISWRRVNLFPTVIPCQPKEKKSRCVCTA